MQTGEIEIKCFSSSTSEVKCDGLMYKLEYQDQPPDPLFWMDIGVCFVLLFIGGLAFGLAFGFISLDRFLLKVRYGKKHPYAKSITPFLKMHSQVLVTFLFTFIGSFQAIPVFMGRIFPDLYAFLIALPVLFLFGQIIPCSICVRWTLTVGYFTRPFIWLLIYLLFPIAWPVAKILDAIHGPASYSIASRPALKEIVQVYTDQANDDETKKEDPFVAAAAATLSVDEVNIILGAINMREKKVRDVMTPLSKVYMLSDSQQLDQKLMEELIEKDYTRIPIYHGSFQSKMVIGMCLTSAILTHLLQLKPGQKASMDDIEVFQLPCVSASTPLYKILNQFKDGKAQMAVVLDDHDNVTPLGIITLGDIFSCLLEIEGINDELNVNDFQKENQSQSPVRSDSVNIPLEAMPLHHVVPSRKISLPAKQEEGATRSVRSNSAHSGLREILKNVKTFPLGVPKNVQFADNIENNPVFEKDETQPLVGKKTKNYNT